MGGKSKGGEGGEVIGKGRGGEGKGSEGKRTSNVPSVPNLPLHNGHIPLTFPLGLLPKCPLHDELRAPGRESVELFGLCIGHV